MPNVAENIDREEKTSLQVAFDASALSVGFKSHLNRGIGRYVRELCKRFENLQEDDLTCLLLIRTLFLIQKI